MPRKVRLPADAALNRESQQRSRARRKEYLASLEARVRDFENREAQATLAMQRAAREVAWVNERLMELLATKGVPKAEVDEFLSRGRRGKEGAAAPTCTRATSRNSGSCAEPSESRGAGAPPITPVARVSARKELKDGSSQNYSWGASMGGRNTADEDLGMGALGYEADELRTNTCDRALQTLRRSSGADESPPALITSCDDAANIIAGFHGHEDVLHARKILGCADAAKCHVKNTRLFQLMDDARALDTRS